VLSSEVLVSQQAELHSQRCWHSAQVLQCNGQSDVNTNRCAHSALCTPQAQDLRDIASAASVCQS
jgi:hypothetical protein